MTNCFICNKHKGEIIIPGGVIYENDLIYIGHIGIDESENNYLGHIMLDLKRHIKGMDEMTNEESQIIGNTLKYITAALKICLNVEHVYINVLGDHVPHFHVHIIPRYKDTPKEFWGNDVKKWDEAPRGGVHEVENIANKLRDFMKNEINFE